jgi:hypothetical protein
MLSYRVLPSGKLGRLKDTGVTKMNQYTNPNQDYMESRPDGSFLIWEDEPLMDILLDSFPGRYTPMTEEAKLQHDAIVLWERECDNQIPDPTYELSPISMEA